MATSFTCVRYTATVLPSGRRKQCENPVTAAGGWCHRCAGYKKDQVPGHAKTADASKTRPAVPVAAVAVTGEAVAVDEVGQCVQQLPDRRNGAAKGAEVRCRNAVRLPQTHCYAHGGDLEHYLGKSYAKALAEAGRGQLVVPEGDEHTKSAQWRQATYQRQLNQMLRTDPSRLAKMAVLARRYNDKHTTGRFGRTNKVWILVSLWSRGKDAGLEGPELDAYIDTRMRQPIHTEAQWKALGYTVAEDAAAMLVSYTSFGGQAVREDGESAEEYEVHKQAASKRVLSRLFEEYLLDDVDGPAWPAAPKAPLDTALPAGHGDPVAAFDQVADYARQLGITVEETGLKPASGAYAYYSHTERKVVVWTGIAGGDPSAKLHSMLHELGHAMDPDAGTHTHHGDQVYARGEVYAESFAYLAMANWGIDTAEMSKYYIGDEKTGWASRLGSSFEEATYSAFAGAMASVDVMLKALSDG